MEKDELIGKRLLDVKRWRNSVLASKHEEDQLRQRLQSRNQLLEQSKADLVDAVINHPTLSNFEKAAWLESIRKGPDDVQQMEESADETLAMLNKLNGAFSQEGTPIVELFWAADDFVPRLKAHRTTGRDLGFSNEFHDFRIGYLPVAEHQDFTWDFVKVSELAAVVTSPEEVDQSQIEKLKRDRLKRLNQRSFIIGEDAIVRFTEKIYPTRSSSRGSHYGTLLLSITERINLDLISKSEILRDVVAEEMQARALTAAKKLFRAVSRDFYTGMSYERVLRFAEDEGAQVDQVLENVKEFYNDTVQNGDAWIAGLEHAHRQARQPAEESGT